MRIVWILNKEMDVSTSQASRLAVADALTNSGHEVTLAARYRVQRHSLGQRNPIIYLPSINLPGLREFSFLISLWFWLPVYLLRVRPDIVMVDRPSLVWALLPWLPLSKLARLHVSWVLDVRSPPTESENFSYALERFSYRLGLRLAGWLMDGWSTITPALRDEVARYGHIPPEKIVIWSSGVFTDIFTPVGQPTPDDWPKQSGFVFIYHGLLSNDRALTECIDALAILNDEINGAALFLLGSGSDQPCLVEHARQLGVQDRVVIHGSVSHHQVPAYLAAADVGLVPAPNTEWFRVSSPLKLMEYLSMGKPIIATDIDAVNGALKGQGDVILVPCGDNGRPGAAALAQGMKEAWQRFGSHYVSDRNRQIAVEEFDWKSQARHLEQYLLDVCRSKEKVAASR